MKIAREILAIKKSDGIELKFEVKVPLSFSARAKGLLGSDSPAHLNGMLFPGCSSVHCFGMKYPIDVLFAKRNGIVVKCVSSLRPGRVAMCFGAHYVLELGAGELERLGIRAGNLLLTSH